MALGGGTCVAEADVVSLQRLARKCFDTVHEFQAAANYETDECRNTCPTSTCLTGWPPPWPASNVTKLKATTYRSSSPATRRGHTTSPVTAMESMVWRHTISPAKKKLNPYQPALNSICCCSYVHFKCPSLHLSGKAFSLSSIKLYVYRVVTDPFGQNKLKWLREQESLSLMSRSVVRWWLRLPVSWCYETVRKYFDVRALACLLEVCCQVRHNAYCSHHHCPAGYLRLETYSLYVSQPQLGPLIQTGKNIFFIVVPCIFITSKLILPTNAPFINHIKC